MERTCSIKMANFGNLKAFVTVKFEEFEITGFKVLESDDGLWVGMPSREVQRNGKKEYFNIVRFQNEETRREFNDWVVAAYKRELESGESAPVRNGNGNGNGNGRRPAVARNNGHRQ